MNMASPSVFASPSRPSCCPAVTERCLASQCCAHFRARFRPVELGGTPDEHGRAFSFPAWPGCQFSCMARLPVSWHGCALISWLPCAPCALGLGRAFRPRRPRPRRWPRRRRGLVCAAPSGRASLAAPRCRALSAAPLAALWPRPRGRALAWSCRAFSGRFSGRVSGRASGRAFLAAPSLGSCLAFAGFALCSGLASPLVAPSLAAPSRPRLFRCRACRSDSCPARLCLRRGCRAHRRGVPVVTVLFRIGHCTLIWTRFMVDRSLVLADSGADSRLT
jgi:hypothetical protein